MAKKATIKIGADTKDAETGLNKLTSTINKIGHNQTITGVKNLGLAFAGVTASLSAAIGAVKAVKAALDDCAEAYKVQAKAERQLEVAAKNNPYLTNTSVINLKKYASELQNISTVGDEQLIPMMAELAAAGRTEIEIQNIMKAALDVSASGVMSLDTAVSALNKTYSGTTGQLAKTIPEVKSLSKEELAQGKAVELVAGKFKGMAEETAKATGTSEQLKNAFGDLKEELGAPFEKAMAPMRKFFATLVSGWADALKAKREYNEAKAAEEAGTQTASQEEILLKREQDNLAKLEGQYSQYKKLIEGYTGNLKTSTKEFINAYNDYQMAVGNVTPEEYIEKGLKPYVKILDDQKDKIETLTAKYQELKEAEEAQAQAEVKAAQQEQQAQKTKSANERAAEAYKQYDETIAKKQAEIEWRRQAGEEISKEAEAQEMATTKLNAWFTMLDKAEGAISGTKGKAVEIMADIQQNFNEVQAADDLQNALDEYEKQYEDFAKDVEKIFKETLKPSEILSQQIDQMEQQWSELTDNSVMWQQKSVEERQRLEEEYTAAHAELCRQREEALRQEAETAKEEAEKSKNERLASLETTMGKVQQLTSGFANAVQAWANVAMQFVQAEKEEQLAALEEQYENGLISLEEYEEKKKQIEKEAAEEEYKIRLWEWTAQCVQAAADLASATIKAYKEGGPILGPIMAGLTAAAGAAQLAAIIGAKPQPPSGFWQGGVVGGFSGASMGRDNTSALVGLREGEMVLNAQQQKNMFDAINSNNLGRGGFTGDIKIYNYAADSTNTDTEVTQDDIRIMITKQVKKDMAAGVYNSEMKQAETTANGVRYTN